MAVLGYLTFPVGAIVILGMILARLLNASGSPITRTSFWLRKSSESS